jgi:hypothetical protein
VLADRFEPHEIVRTRARLDLDEAQLAVSLDDDVDLSAGAAPVPCEHRPAVGCERVCDRRFCRRAEGQRLQASRARLGRVHGARDYSRISTRRADLPLRSRR